MRALAITAIVLTLPFTGCMPDDWDGAPYVPATPASTPVADTASPTDATDDAALVGSWRSADDDVSPLFAGDPFAYVQVDADFRADGTYTVTSLDDGGTEYVLSGRWTADDASQPGTVLLVQAEPYEAEAIGIWGVEDDVLSYEVVQTLPDYGFAPPTPAGGFGSTGGPGMDAGINVQVYRRRP